MPIEIYKLGIEGIELIVKLVRKKKLSTLKNVVKELRIFSKMKSKKKFFTKDQQKNIRKFESALRKTSRAKPYRAKPTAKQIRARKLFAMRVRRGDFR